ncbi:MAG: hypothetical protein ACREDS_01785 [Limisphaerales bacterium]
MKPPKQYGIFNLLFWIFIFHVPLIFSAVCVFFCNLTSEPKHENQVVIGVIALFFLFLSMTAWLYIPAIIVCIWIFGDPSVTAMGAFCSCQAFIMALSLWLFKRAKERHLQANTALEPMPTAPPVLTKP